MIFFNGNGIWVMDGIRIDLCWFFLIWLVVNRFIMIWLWCFVELDNLFDVLVYVERRGWGICVGIWVVGVLLDLWVE